MRSFAMDTPGETATIAVEATPPSPPASVNTTPPRAGADTDCRGCGPGITRHEANECGSIESSHRINEADTTPCTRVHANVL